MRTGLTLTQMEIKRVDKNKMGDFFPHLHLVGSRNCSGLRYRRPRTPISSSSSGVDDGVGQFGGGVRDLFPENRAQL